MTVAATDSNPLKTRTYSFEDLRLPVGHNFQIVVPGSIEPLQANLLGYLKESSLIIRVPAQPAAKSAVLTEGESIKVKGFSGRIVYFFDSSITKVRNTPYTYYHILFPKAIHGAEVRGAMRVKTKIAAEITNTNGEPSPAVIINLSNAGALITVEKNVGAIGDTLSINFSFKIPPNDHEVNLKVASTIRSASQPDQSSTSTQYGVQFDSVPTTEGIMLQNLVQHLLLENPGAFV